MKIKLSKLEVAERQLNEGIRLFFEDSDPVSIHTLVAAAERVLSDLGKKKNIYSPIRDAELYIKPEGHTIWFQKMNESANFFKHADKDNSVEHEFDSEVNVFHILSALFVMRKLDKLSHEMNIFTQWFILKYPNFIKDENDETIKKIKSAALNYNISPDNKQQFSTMLYVREIQ